VILLLALHRPYAERRDNARAIISEILLLVGTLSLWLQNSGTLENETTRQRNAWYSIYFFFSILVLQVFLLVVEIFFPYLLLFYYRVSYEKRDVQVYSTRQNSRSNTTKTSAFMQRRSISTATKQFSENT
jgi:hypothetical protein